MAAKRGALIVLEGLDKSGKTTQCEKLYEFLQRKNFRVKLMKFPLRDSTIGKVIDSYLTKKVSFPHEAIHLLFTANRWEFENEMRTLLESGTTLVVDRYSYSGLAFSVAKGLPYEWCYSPEKGLIEPDKIFYLHAPVEELATRPDYGAEKYEELELQRKAAKEFDSMCDQQHTLWQRVDADMSREEVSDLISIETLKVIQDVQNLPLKLLK